MNKHQKKDNRANESKASRAQMFYSSHPLK